MGAFKTAATLAIGLLIGASAMAMAETPPQTYTACLGKDGTILRVAIGTAPAQACRPNERQISWNSEGPQGPKGEPGTGGGIGSLDDLDGTPCNLGAPGEGILDLRYLIEGDVLMTCVPAATYSVVVSFTGSTPGYVGLYGVGPGGDKQVCTTSVDPCVYAVPYGRTVTVPEFDGLDGARAYPVWSEGPLVGQDMTMWEFTVTSDVTLVGEFVAGQE